MIYIPLVLLTVSLTLWIFAQTLPEAFSGWAGWGGFLSSGGVLAWFLLKYLPDVHRRDERKDELHREHIKAMMVEYKSSLREILGHCERETTKVADAVVVSLREEFERLQQRWNDDESRFSKERKH